jgi:hypothetical protein
MDSLFLLGILVGIAATAAMFIGTERSMERRS